MTRSPLFNFIIGMVFGVALGAGAISWLSIRATHNLAGDALTVIHTWENASAGWQARAESCEQRFTTGTIVYEPRPAAELPLFHGAVSLAVNQFEAQPAWYIPARVNVYTSIPGARYQWQDMRTGEMRGEFAALPVSAMAAMEKPEEKATTCTSGGHTWAARADGMCYMADDGVH